MFGTRILPPGKWPFLGCLSIKKISGVRSTSLTLFVRQLERCSLSLSVLWRVVLTDPSTVECRKEADVVFVIDSTSNLQEKDFQKFILGTIDEIIQHLDVDWGTARVAAVPFTNTAKVSFSMLAAGSDTQHSSLLPVLFLDFWILWTVLCVVIPRQCVMSAHTPFDSITELEMAGIFFFRNV